MNIKDALVVILSILSRRQIPLLSNTLKSYIVECNPYRGKAILTSEGFLAEYIVPEKGKCLVDIGASVGIWSLFVAEKGIEVHAFEPAPQTYGILKDKAKKYPNLHVYPWAIGNKDSVGKMGLYNHPWSGGVMEKAVVNPGEKTIDVTVHTLDSVNLANIGVIKIDTEGYETPILIGAKKTILKNKPMLLIEVHRGTGKASQSYAEEFDRIKNILKTFGYTWTVLYRRLTLREAQPFVIANASIKV